LEVLAEEINRVRRSDKLVFFSLTEKIVWRYAEKEI
jgi:hypothetical protein